MESFQGQWAADEKQRSPTAKADKGFLMAKGKVNLEVTLDREVNYHGQELPVHIFISNTSKKSVKCIKVSTTTIVEEHF